MKLRPPIAEFLLLLLLMEACLLMVLLRIPK